MLKIFFTAIFLVMIVGCSGPEDKLYTSFKCGKAAFYMGESKFAENAMKNAEQYAKDIDFGGSTSRYFMMLGDKFQDEYELYRYNAYNQAGIIQEIYDSSECQDLYIVQ